MDLVSLTQEDLIKEPLKLLVKQVKNYVVALSKYIYSTVQWVKIEVLQIIIRMYHLVYAQYLVLRVIAFPFPTNCFPLLFREADLK